MSVINSKILSTKATIDKKESNISVKRVNDI